MGFFKKLFGQNETKITTKTTCEAYLNGECINLRTGKSTGKCSWNPRNWKQCNVVIENRKTFKGMDFICPYYNNRWVYVDTRGYLYCNGSSGYPAAEKNDYEKFCIKSFKECPFYQNSIKYNISPDGETN